MRAKWLKYGRYLYYFGLIFYGIFLALMTSFALLQHELKFSELNGTEEVICNEAKLVWLWRDGGDNFMIYICQYAILIISIAWWSFFNSIG